MAEELVTDELWEVIEPLLPEEPPEPNGGGPRIDDRAALTGILFVLESGIPWEMLPRESNRGSGMICCWQRLMEWREAGVWEHLYRILFDRLGKADEGDRDWERASLDSASVPASGGGARIAFRALSSYNTRGPSRTMPPRAGNRRHFARHGLASLADV